MKKSVAISFIGFFNFIFYLSMRSIWSGIEGMIGVSWLALLLFFILIILALMGFLLIFFRKSKFKIISTYGVGGINIVFTFVLFYMFYLGIGSLRYILRGFEEGLLYLFILSFIFFMIFYYPKSRFVNNRILKVSLFVLIATFIITQAIGLRINLITNMPVVYAVNDEYQIVWTTRANSVSAVKVGDNYYYDLYAGSMRSQTRVHKVAVPMDVLDQAKAYEISSTTMIYRGPYSGVKGRTITKNLEFKPVDLSDGLNYYALSDTHEYSYAGKKTGNYFGDELDFLVLLGDISSHLERHSDIEIINEIAYEITKGKHPVVYARGNHEVKSEVANDLHRYVGSVNEKFYFTFNLNGVFGIVLDLGEDHDDDWWEFYDTAKFDLYREEQTKFLQEIILKEEYKGNNIKYKIAISHMPVNFVRGNFLPEVKASWTELLNQIDLDIMISGHQHQLLQITTDLTPDEPLYFHEKYSSSKSIQGIRLNSNFDTFIVSRRSDSQDLKYDENLYGRKLIGLATTVDFNTKKIIMKYTNINHEVVKIVHPFTGVEFETYTIDLKG